MLPREARAVGVDPLGVEVVAGRRLGSERELGAEVGAGEAGAMRQAAAHPFQQAGRLAAQAGGMVDRDGTEAADELGRGVGREELAERLTHRQAARDGEVANGPRVREGELEEIVAYEGAVRDDATAARRPVQPRREFLDGHAVGPDVDREVALEPGRDERFEFGGRLAVREHERLAAAFPSARRVEETEHVDLGFERGGGFAGRPGREDDEAARITLGETDGLVETGLRVVRRDARAEHQHEVHLRGARGFFALVGPRLVERREDGGDLDREARERVDQRMGHDQRPALRQACPWAPRRASPPAGPQEPAA